MPRIHTFAERIVDADPSTVWAALVDFAGARTKILPDNYSDVRVERDVNGGDAIFSYHLKAGGRERDYRMEAVETEPGVTLTERDLASTFTTRWHIERIGPGDHTRVSVSSEWESMARGAPGFFERRFAPLGVRRLHQETLVRLGRLMRERQGSVAGRE
jgi:hypothetical protein